MKNKENSANKPVKTIFKLHGWKIAWIITALGMELAFLIYVWNEKQLTGFSWAKPVPTQAVEYTCYIIVAIMLIPPVIMAVHVFRHRAEKIDNYDLKKTAPAFLKWFVSSFLYFICFVYGAFGIGALVLSLDIWRK